VGIAFGVWKYKRNRPQRQTAPVPAGDAA